MNDSTLPAERKISYATVEMEPSGQGGFLSPKNLGDVVAFASVMARAGSAIPAHLRQKEGDCLAVSMLALHWEMNPFMVAMKSYKVGDVIAYESQLIAAVLNTRAPLKSRLIYSYSGEGPELTCTVTGTFRDGTVQSYTSPRIGDIRIKNSPLWKDDPPQQLGYYSVRSWGRRYCPEVIMGVYDREEAMQMRDVTPEKSDLRARLEAANKTGEGFTAENGHHIIDAKAQSVIDAAALPVTNPTIDEVLDGDQIPAFDAPPKRPRGRPRKEAPPPIEAAQEPIQAQEEASDAPLELGTDDAPDAESGSTDDPAIPASEPTTETDDGWPGTGGDIGQEEPESRPEVLAYLNHPFAGYADVKSALVHFRRIAIYADASNAERVAWQRMSLNRLDELRERNVPVPAMTSDPWQFMLYAGQPDAENLEQLFNALCESPAYDSMSEGQQDAIRKAAGVP